MVHVRSEYKGMSYEQASKEAHRLMERKLSSGGRMSSLIGRLTELNAVMEVEQVKAQFV